MALPDELSAANIAILVSKSAAEAVRMKLAYVLFSWCSLSYPLALVAGSLSLICSQMCNVAKETVKDYQGKEMQ